MTVAVIVLAAGKGTRMKSEKPKVLHCLAGKPLLSHVLDTAKQIAAEVVVVTGHGAELVKEQNYQSAIHYALQREQLGTAHAVSCGLHQVVGEAEKILILYGDVPLVEQATLEQLLSLADRQNLGLLTVFMADPTGYGRIVRDSQGEVIEIVEQADATVEQLMINEVNTGIMAVRREYLNAWLPQISNKNAQGEYYLTDLAALARKHNINIATCQPEFPEEVAGVNDRVQLASLERHYQRKVAERLMLSGNTLIDPARFDCRGDLKAGIDNRIDVNCVFEGNVQLGSNIYIGPNCYIRDCSIADYAEIKANTVIDGAEVGRHAIVGPFARLRPGTKLAADTRVGNFVETKNAVVGMASKINHLSYVGDAVLGSKVNIGAGTITCNYDGANKHQTEIHDEAFIGSNTSLVAPVTIGARATIGAGSTITRDVPDNQLALTRSRQNSIEGWKRPEKKQP